MASLLVFITFLLLRLCTVQAVVLTLRPAVSPIYPVDLRQVRLRDHVNIAILKSVTTGIGAGRQIYEVPSFISMANAFPPVSLNFPGGVSMLLKPQEMVLLLGRLHFRNLRDRSQSLEILFSKIR
ncbi:uncharacterized protein LOC103942018 isoform X3 [Pyrus x bretschneideri]|uniref:uncharacterized protein LOC103942018 isoform X3 n=1 Tax=Pyrus x bretschneideri TaxID=225117 RepID=UPI00202F440F|nr:uncharacterized protein LOC103942018 isoform X3 [Pyrus x bretschneideri]